MQETGAQKTIQRSSGARTCIALCSKPPIAKTGLLKTSIGVQSEDGPGPSGLDKDAVRQETAKAAAAEAAAAEAAAAEAAENEVRRGGQRPSVTARFERGRGPKAPQSQSQLDPCKLIVTADICSAYVE